jgi:micrococcal nuclease
MSAPLGVRGLCVSLLAASVAACGGPAPDRAGTETPSSGSTEIGIARIADAERWVLRIGGREVRVRLIGVDARFAARIGCTSSDDAIAGLVAGDRLRIERDSRAEDLHGRSWVWLWSGDELINAAILRQGLATLSRYWPNQRHETELLRAQLGAARGRLGLWGTCSDLRPGSASDGSRRACDPSYPGRCVPPFPPDLDCERIRFANFSIVGPDLHDLDGDGDGLGCERYNPM